MSPAAVFWFRRDFRISDHSALQAAIDTRLVLIPLYITSTWSESHAWTGAKRQQFLCESLESLAHNLETVHTRLIIRHGAAFEAFAQLLRDYPEIHEIHTQGDPDPFGKAVESALAAWCDERGIRFFVHRGVTVHLPHEVLTQQGQPFRVYTPFSKTWLSLPKSAPIGRIGALDASQRVPDTLASEPLPTLAHWNLTAQNSSILPGGERAARLRMKHFLKAKIGNYDAQRDFPGVQMISQLSQDLRWGLISARELASHCYDSHGNVAPNALKYLKEIIWREFYFAILHTWPEVLTHEFSPNWRGMPWQQDSPHLEAWKTGTTGFPIVDAGMRELVKTGLMHNRVRMITAMFLTKDLHVDWRVGEQFFLQHLIDGEIASNNGGWQWSAGTGADAAPYFRIQNPWLQSQRYDPDGAYIKHWIPELAEVPAANLHKPASTPLAAQYPLPILDHSLERDRTMAIFKAHANQLR